MLSEQQLNKLAVEFHGNIVNVAREYIQHLFLSYFYSLKGSDKILFKGGTALRILYKSPRFSEDLDFSAKYIDKHLIENLLADTIAKLDKEGIKLDVIESKKTTGGYLSILSFLIGSNKFNISIEISARKKKITKSIDLIDNSYITPYTLVSLNKEELIKEKIEALIDRKKPRDFYDLYFLLRANLVPDKSILKKILPLIDKTKIDFKRELKEFLPVSHHNIIKNFKKTLESEVKRFI